jgi:hypothetical protein
MKYLIFLGLFILVFLVALPADAAICHSFQGQKLCVVNIKRSAKKYWEYRVTISRDGEIQPVEIYNCRSKYRVNQDKVILSFEPNDIGNLICKTLAQK